MNSRCSTREKSHEHQRSNHTGARVLNYLNPCSEKRLLSCVERHYLERHSSVMIEKGFSDLMLKNAHEDLALMYELYVLLYKVRVYYSLDVNHTRKSNPQVRSCGRLDSTQRCVQISHREGGFENCEG